MYRHYLILRQSVYVHVSLYVIYNGGEGNTRRRYGTFYLFFFLNGKHNIYMGNYTIFYESDKVYERFPEENNILYITYIITPRCTGLGILIKN